MNQNATIGISDLSHSYAGEKVLNRTDLELASQKIIGLIGPSGSGKSTLLKILGGVLEANSGSVLRGGLDLEQVSLMFQEGALFDSLSVSDNVAFPVVPGNIPLSLYRSEDAEKYSIAVAKILNRVGLLSSSEKMPAQISGGMRRRVSLARALVSDPRLVLLDDPTAGLDPVASSVIMDLIVEIFNEQHPTCIIASHDLRRLLPVCHEVIALFDGSVVFQGNLEELKSAPQKVKEFVACRYDLESINE